MADVGASDTPRRRRAGRRERPTDFGPPQPPFRLHRRRFDPVRGVSDDELEAIHHASLRVLRDIGVDLLHPTARQLLIDQGGEAKPSAGPERITMEPEVVLDLIGSAPSDFELYARNPERNVRIGGDQVVFTDVASTPNVADRAGGRRTGNRADFRNLVKLASTLNAVQIHGGYPVEPADIHASVRHLHATHDLLTLSDKVPNAYSLGAQRNIDCLEMVRIARGVTDDEIDRQPSVTTVINASSPLRLDTPMAEGILQFSARNQVIIFTPFTLAGAMAPVTLAGALVQQNAEALFGIALTQAARAGSPVIYGGFTSNVDMQSGAPAFGTPEFMKAALVGGQLARRYGLPYRSSNVNAANSLDAQAGYESVFSLWGAVMGGANLVFHGAGWMEGGLHASYEKMVLDADLINMVSTFLDPIVVDDASLAVEAIAEVGPGGHFFGVGHTQDRYRDAFFAPMISDWRNYEAWAEAGSPTALDRAEIVQKQLLDHHIEPHDVPRRTPRARRVRCPPRRRGRRGDRLLIHGEAMKTQTQVVVVGGGVVGASVLYHLTRGGWTDVVLLERTELTAGSTWHSAGGMHTLNGDPNVAKLQQYTIELYKEIEEISGQDCGIHVTGGVMLADNEQRMDWLRNAHAKGRYLGMETELISVAEAKELHPIFEEKYFVGAMYDAHEGHVDPSGVTHAFAKAARQNGAEVYRNTWVRHITRAPDGGWDVHTIRTDTGEELETIRCEHVVNAGGLWAREVGRMVGLELPLLAMEHQYILTEDIPAVAEYNASTGHEVLHAIDFGGEIYMRQEAGGLLLGTYEHNGRPWSPKETSWDFGMRLLSPDLEHIAANLEVGFAHFPIFAEAGIRQVVNGPFTFAADGNPLLGPVRGLPGYWSACAVMAGLSQGGGVGLALANWMTEGDPGFDIWGMDISRFGDFANMAYTNAKVVENYGRRFRIQYPNEFLPAARNLQTSPIHDRLTAANAVWGNAYGLESAQWFQREGEEPVEELTWYRSNAWDQVRAETEAVRTGVGLIETTGFAKFEFSGAGARAFLGRILAGRIPKPGRMALTPMTNHAGKLIGDLTVACLGPATGEAEGPASTVTGGATANTDSVERFFVFGSGIAERYYERYFDQQIAVWNDDSGPPVRYRTCGYELCGLSIAGPRSRELLERVTTDEVSGEAFRFMDFRRLDVGMVPTLSGRVTFTGDLGYEFWMPASYQRHLYDLLMVEGEDLGITLFGSATLDSLRLEKSFGSWAREYRPIYDPFEANLGRFIQMGRDFIGRDALVRVAEHGPERALCTWTVDVPAGREGADVMGDEPVWLDDEVVGWITSGGYAHASDRSVAMGYVPAAHADRLDGWEIEILGVRRTATLRPEPIWDPQGLQMRS